MILQLAGSPSPRLVDQRISRSGHITMYGLSALVPVLSAASALLALIPGASAAAPAAQCYNWKSVRIGGGGGFVPGIIFNPGMKGLAYARTDIGGAYKLNSDDTWKPLTDFATGTDW